MSSSLLSCFTRSSRTSTSSFSSSSSCSNLFQHYKQCTTMNLQSNGRIIMMKPMMSSSTRSSSSYFSILSSFHSSSFPSSSLFFNGLSQSRSYSSKSTTTGDGEGGEDDKKPSSEKEDAYEEDPSSSSTITIKVLNGNTLENGSLGALIEQIFSENAKVVMATEKEAEERKKEQNEGKKEKEVVDPTTTPTSSSSTTTAAAATNSQTTLVEEEEEANATTTAEKALYPREVVSELDRYIVGQTNAKRAVAIALRNRWRFRQLPSNLREEIIPKNILMIGPTGVGKTEIARRLARLSNAPFLKVEATKFTELGFVGRDVETIIHDLMEIGLTQAKERAKQRLGKKAEKEVETRLLDILVGNNAPHSLRDRTREQLRKGELENKIIDIETPERAFSSLRAGRRSGGAGGGGMGGLDGTDLGGGPKSFSFSSGLGNGGGSDSAEGPGSIFMDLGQLFGNFPRSRKRKLTIAESRPILIEQETERLTNQDAIFNEAKEMVEQNGIVFIDEIDKICVPKHEAQFKGDASDEGVQRDLLPLIEGSSVTTRYGNIDTSKILFIASGAFHSCKPSDLLAELQGRLPIRVELKALSREDLYRILTEPEFNLIRQQVQLMKTEGIQLVFTDAAIKEIARIAAEVNTTVENIGARRLHTVIERLMEEISFNCGNISSASSTSPEGGLTVLEIDAPLVRQRVGDLLLKTDMSRFVL